jgi:hypothetical protein
MVGTSTPARLSSVKVLCTTVDGLDNQEDRLFAELSSDKLGLRRRRAPLKQLGRFGSERSVEVLQDNLRHRDVVRHPSTRESGGSG